MQPSQPVIKPFSYLYIPADDTKPVEERHFTGSTEAELKRTLTAHFRTTGMSTGQRSDMATHLRAEADKNNRKYAVQPKAKEGEGEGAKDVAAGPAKGGEVAVVPPAADEPPVPAPADLLDIALDTGSYEIVPVVMPTRATRFTGTSLYIDDAGRFKERPLNGRASHLSQRDIRGDGFLLCSHDDPALEEWSRVTCTMENYEAIKANPKPTLDTGNQAAMAAAAVARESDTKVISPEDAAASVTAKADGNAFFAKGDAKAALQAYSMCIELTDGRADLLPNGAEVAAARQAAFLNRSLCHIRLEQFASAEKDALKVVLDLDQTSVKGWFRLATAQTHQNDFGTARKSLARCVQLGGSTPEAGALTETITVREQHHSQRENKKYAKMFA